MESFVRKIISKNKSPFITADIPDVVGELEVTLKINGCNLDYCAPETVKIAVEE